MQFTESFCKFENRQSGCKLEDNRVGTPVEHMNREGTIRVLAVIPGKSEGASMIFSRRQVEALSATGTNIRSFYVQSRTAPVLVFREWKRLRNEIRQYQPHLLHAHYGTVTSFLCAISSSCPLVVTFRGGDLNPDSAVGWFRSNLGHVLSQISAIRAKQVICVSRQLQAKLWWRNHSALVLPTGVDLEMFQPMPKSQARSQLNWDPDWRVVVFNASVQPIEKGLPLVLAAVEHARSKIGPIRLEVLNGRIPPQEIPTIFNAADCLVLASEYEGSPTVVQEALACNLPVVSVDVGDVAERLCGVSHSRIVERDPIRFGNALAEVLSFRSRCNGRDIVADCSLSRVAAETYAVYQALAHAQDEVSLAVS
jgi:glycosyltransferase involved in cell wall biosynthesis